TIFLSGYDGAIGGSAFLNGYGSESKGFGFCNVTGQVDTAAAYDWDIHIVSHELGHLLGSPHTNACVWGPEQNQALDACGEVHGSCQPKHHSSSGGIMSSCHLFPQGIDLADGLGAEPGARIRAFLLYQQLQRDSCPTAQEISLSGSWSVDFTTGGVESHHEKTDRSVWFYIRTDRPMSVRLGSCDQGVDTRLHLYFNYCADSIWIQTVDDNCLSGDGLRYASKVDSIHVPAETELWIEWDNRWSDEAFEFEISITEDLNPCNVDSELPTQITENTAYRSQEPISYQGEIFANGSLGLSSSASIEIQPSTQVAAGGKLELQVTDCQEPTLSLSGQ
ncbi:MAG: hypothetical protein AAFQ02_11060, partial [Bacteroidota bacterium]